MHLLVDAIMVNGGEYDDCQVVCERTSWKGGYVGINSFGIAGSNVHVLLRSPDTVSPVRTIHVAATTPRLVTCSGRTKEAVEVALAEMCRHPTNTDLQYLLQNSLGDLWATTHSYRGFTLVNAAVSRQMVEVCTGLMDRVVPSTRVARADSIS